MQLPNVMAVDRTLLTQETVGMSPLHDDIPGKGAILHVTETQMRNALLTRSTSETTRHDTARISNQT
jgi:hypothetical protein